MRKKQNDERYQNAIYLHYFLCPVLWFQKEIVKIGPCFLNYDLSKH